MKLPKSRAKPKIPSRKKERIPITPAQWGMLMQRFPREHPSHIALNLGYHLGLRLGETFGLMWEDVDFDNGTISIQRQVQYDQQAKAWELTAPKYESFRTISVDDVLLALLKDEYQRQQRAQGYFRERYQQVCVDERGYLGSVGKPVHLVNTRENGTFIQPRSLQHTSRVIHKELNMPLFDFHSLRHTHTTLLLEAGANPLDVQERLGHSHLAITWRYQQVCVDERSYLGSVGKPVHLVNTRENGTFIQPRALQHTSRVIHKELNMPLFDFHSLRHTHTTLLLEAGANPLDVQERLGHSHLAITWRYAHNTDAIREQTHKILSTIYK